ncbi:hypothetical protein A3731_06470 [Roseovarius sp. HI0049]|nr:hypothetical protein A3731_34100 [Roseovarius sp. HI0049]KZY48668.1 hypothetical protein A3731_06470 [Roseovarius sp. HI0049]
MKSEGANHGYNADFVRSLGADVVIDYRTEDYVEIVNRETGGAGVDVILDTIGDDTLERSPHVLAQVGRIVSIVDIAQPQNLIEAWGRNASYHLVFTRQNRGKLDELDQLMPGRRIPRQRETEGKFSWL